MNCWSDDVKFWITLISLGLPAAVFLYRQERGLPRFDFLAHAKSDWASVLGFLVVVFSNACLVNAVILSPSILLQVIFKSDRGDAIMAWLGVMMVGFLPVTLIVCWWSGRRRAARISPVEKAIDALPSLISRGRGRWQRPERMTAGRRRAVEAVMIVRVAMGRR